MNFRQMLAAALLLLRGQLDGVLPRWASDRGDDATQATQLHRDLAPVLRDFFGSVDMALAAVETGRIEAAAWLGRAIYTMDERQRQSREVEATARRQYEAFHGQATAALNRATQLVRAAGVPDRPAPADAAQEAALANLRTDLRMVLDKTPGAEVPSRIARMAGDAASNRDALRLWLLAGTSWPRDYLDSRGQLAMADWMTAQTALAVLPAAGQDMGQALTIAPWMEVGKDAARRVLETFLPSVLAEELDDLGDMRQRAASLAGGA